VLSYQTHGVSAHVIFFVNHKLNVAVENEAPISEVGVVRGWMKTECWAPVERYIPTQLMGHDAFNSEIYIQRIFREIGPSC
jgi:hypothetical protein